MSFNLPSPTRVNILSANTDANTVIKVAVIPFIRNRGGSVEYYFYKPQAIHDNLPPPKFQICKGTRKILPEGEDKWRDVIASDLQHSDNPGELESMLKTALREGREEIGLKSSNIKKMFDLGVAGFKSQSTGKYKYMRVFACEVKNKDDFDAPEPIAGETATAERKWADLEWFEQNGREDNACIISALEKHILYSCDRGRGSDSDAICP